MIDFAYSRMDLRYNPFGELDRQQRIDNALPRCDLNTLQQFLQHRSNSRRTAVQFIGRPGSGKSTHMLLLATSMPDFRYTHLPVDMPRHVPNRSHLMVDEAQRLSWRQRNRLFRNADRIVLGTHRCFEKRLKAMGFDVKTISLDSRPDVDWLVNALNRKIDAATRSGLPGCQTYQIERPTAFGLLQEFGCNLRGIERRLYDHFHALNSEPNAESLPVPYAVVPSVTQPQPVSSGQQGRVTR